MIEFFLENRKYLMRLYTVIQIYKKKEEEEHQKVFKQCANCLYFI